MGPLSIIMTFGRIRSNVESMAKSLEIDVFLYTSPIHSYSAYPTNPTILIITCGFLGSNVTLQFSAMKMFLHCLVWKLLLIGPPPLLQLSVADNKNEIQGRTGSLSPRPCSLELFADLCKFLWACLPNANIVDNYSWRKNMTQLKYQCINSSMISKLGLKCDKVYTLFLCLKCMWSATEVMRSIVSRVHILSSGTSRERTCFTFR